MQLLKISTSQSNPVNLTMRLPGLDPSASQSILSQVGIVAGSEQYQQLVARYSGNPLALKIVAATIRSVFNGDVADFFSYGTVVFGDLWDLLDQQFERLSDIEQTVMRWLAINREWTSIQTLRADIMALLQLMSRDRITPSSPPDYAATPKISLMNGNCQDSVAKIEQWPSRC